MTFPWLLHIQRFKIKDLLHASWHESYMYRGHKLRPLLPLRTTHKVLVTVQEHVEDTIIWSDYINVSLYWNTGWKKGTMPFRERMPFNFHDFLWIFQNLESLSMTFPGLEKKNGIPWLFRVFHDWIHPGITTDITTAYTLDRGQLSHKRSWIWTAHLRGQRQACYHFATVVHIPDWILC